MEIHEVVVVGVQCVVAEANVARLGAVPAVDVVYVRRHLVVGLPGPSAAVLQKVLLVGMHTVGDLLAEFGCRYLPHMLCEQAASGAERRLAKGARPRGASLAMHARTPVLIELRRAICLYNSTSPNKLTLLNTLTAFQ